MAPTGSMLFAAVGDVGARFAINKAQQQGASACIRGHVKSRMLKIKIENLSKIYRSRSGHVSALEDVNLDILQNEFITLDGPSGCGKSTLLKIIGALIRPSRGTLHYDGKTLLQPTRDVGIVFQEPVLLPWRTALDNVLLPAEILGLDIAASRPRAMILAIEPQRLHWHIQDLIVIEQGKPRLLSDKFPIDQPFIID